MCKESTMCVLIIIEASKADLYPVYGTPSGLGNLLRISCDICTSLKSFFLTSCIHCGMISLSSCTTVLACFLLRYVG